MAYLGPSFELPRALARTPLMNSPLQAEGLSRRVYPFLGLAIVGLVSLHGFSAVAASPALVAALVLGVLLVLVPLIPAALAPASRFAGAAPVVTGFGLAMYPLWSGLTAIGILSSL